MRTLVTSFVTSFLFLACTGEVASTADKTANATGTPVAEAGTGGTFSSDQPIQLDGSSSTDPDGDTLTYHWSFSRVPDGSALLENTEIFQNNGTEISQTRFFADTAGSYIIELVVTDSTDLSSEPDSVVINVEQGQLPVANAGIDISILEGDTVTLDGSSSADPLGRSLNYSWSISNGPRSSTTASLSSATVVSPMFTPDVSGSYLISLVVHNGINASLPDSMVVNVITANPLAPTADAGPDITDAQDCSDIQLNGAGSTDPNGDSLEYMWTLQAAPTASIATSASISDQTAVQPTFWPDIAGEYILSLAVFDGTDWSLPDLVTITASERISNAAPIVEAGSSLSLDGGTADCELSGYNYNCAQCSPVLITIGTDASVSDNDGDPVSYEWVVLSGDVSISEPDSIETTATFSGATPDAPSACTETTYELELIAEDCPGGGDNDSISVVVTCCGVEVISQ